MAKQPIRTFRDIIAWQLAMRLCESVYAFSKQLPADERFGMISQLQRAAVSVPSNIAEGYGHGWKPAFLRHLRFSRGSLAEVITQVELATRLHGVQPDKSLRELMAETDRVLQALIRSLDRAPARDEADDPNK